MRVFQGLTGYSTDVIDRTARDTGFVSPRWFQELRNSRAFGGGFQYTAAAGQFPHIQLFNPVGSTITVIVYSVWANGFLDAVGDVNFYNTALTTDRGAGVNLVNGGAAAQAHIRSQDNAAALGTNIWRWATNNNPKLQYSADWFCQLAAGQGVLVTIESAAVQLFADFKWIEV